MGQTEPGQHETSGKNGRKTARSEWPTEDFAPGKRGQSPRQVHTEQPGERTRHVSEIPALRGPLTYVLLSSIENNQQAVRDTR